MVKKYIMDFTHREILSMDEFYDLEHYGYINRFHLYKAKATGEKRCPKKGEWYLSGADIMAYQAPNDLSDEYYIVKIYRMVGEHVVYDNVTEVSNDFYKNIRKV